MIQSTKIYTKKNNPKPKSIPIIKNHFVTKFFLLLAWGNFAKQQ